MVNKILFWGGFGIAVRLWQLGIEMRPLFQRQSAWMYPVYAAIGGSFGYWLQGAETRQFAVLEKSRERLLEKRARKAEREGQTNTGSEAQLKQDGQAASVAG